ncbi:MAG: NOB1 family endonuclease [Candidatus Bathyarchaeia archaeon]
MTTEERVLVLDASAFIAGFDPLSVGEKQYSVPEVGRELVSNSLPWVRFNTAVDGGRLTVGVPTGHSLRRVKEASKRVGDIRFLSDADLRVLALALELKNEGYNSQIVTDDYSIQNVADQLGIGFAPLMTFGIRFRLQWILYCPACYRKYPSDYRFKSCEVCGTKLKRKPLKKIAVRKSE